MKLFVTGATGAIGRYAVPALVAAGHEVTGVARSDTKAAWLRQQGAAAVNVSIFDRAPLADAMAGHDAVVNLATHIPAPADARKPEAWAENNRIRTEGSATLVDATLDAGVGRVVQEAITFTYPDRGDAWIDEDTPLDVGPPWPRWPTPRPRPPASPPPAAPASCCGSPALQDRARRTPARSWPRAPACRLRRRYPRRTTSRRCTWPTPAPRW